MTVSYLMEDYKKVSAYELAKAVKTYSSPKAAIVFANEFPDSPIRERVFRLLRNHLNQNDKVAGEVCKKLLEKYPDDLTLNASYIRFLAANEKFDQALIYADNLYNDPEVRESGSNIAEYVNLLARAGKTEKMNLVAETYLKDYPDDDSFYESLYYVYHDNGMFGKVFDLLERGLKANPNHIYLYYAYGRSAIESKMNYDQAENYLKKFAELALNAESDLNAQFAAPSWQAAANWRIGLIYEARGDTDKAVSVYKEGLKHDPENKNLIDALDKVSKGK